MIKGFSQILVNGGHVWVRGCCGFGSMVTEPVHTSRTSNSQLQGFFSLSFIVPLLPYKDETYQSFDSLYR